MNKVFSLLALSFIILPNHLYAYKYGLGSCLDQDLDQPIWSAIKEKNIDGFIFLGDNVYGDQHGSEEGKLEKAYEKQKSKIPLWLTEEKKILAIWDDHDYGKNDGGGEYEYKKESKDLFLDFWQISDNDPRRSREGIYFEESQIIEGKIVQIIGLDTRYFRSQLVGSKNGYQPNNDPLASLLGQEQWEWFETVLENSKAKIIVILSSIQILATNHPYEKWANFTLDRNKLLAEIKNASKDKKIIAISGDRHRAGLYQQGDFIEITASALNKGASQIGIKTKPLIQASNSRYVIENNPAFFYIETDPLLLGVTYPEINFGILDIEPSKNKITLSINDKDGNELESKVINL
jgi:alkaline phosphatase D